MADSQSIPEALQEIERDVVQQRWEERVRESCFDLAFLRDELLKAGFARDEALSLVRIYYGAQVHRVPVPVSVVALHHTEGE